MVRRPDSTRNAIFMIEGETGRQTDRQRQRETEREGGGGMRKGERERERERESVTHFRPQKGNPDHAHIFPSFSLILKSTTLNFKNK